MGATRAQRAEILSKGVVALAARAPTTLRVLNVYCLVVGSADLGTVILPGLLLGCALLWGSRFLIYGLIPFLAKVGAFHLQNKILEPPFQLWYVLPQ